MSNPVSYPSINDVLPAEWRSLKHAAYKAVHWSANEGVDHSWYTYRDTDKALVCNGIFITGELLGPRGAGNLLKDPSALFSLHTPRISVFDSEGNLPVNLQRTELHHLPFAKELNQEVIKDVIAYILVTAPNHSAGASPLTHSLIDRQVSGCPVP